MICLLTRWWAIHIIIVAFMIFMFCVPRDCYRIYILKRGFYLIFLGYDNICFNL